MEGTNRRPNRVRKQSKDRSLSSAHFLLLCLALLLSALLNLSSLKLPHQEGDEIIYLALIKNLLDTGRYSIQGTPILASLPAHIYDKPLFHHPPLYFFLAAPLLASVNENAVVLLSWLGHFLTIIAVYLLVRKKIADDDRFLALILFLVVFDPILVFCSRKIWLDSCLASFAALSVACFYEAFETGKKRIQVLLFAGAGFFFACSVLTKIIAGVMAPVFLLIFWQKGFFRNFDRDKGVYLAWFFGPLILLLAPWFIQFFSVYGSFVPHWIYKSSGPASENAFITMVTNRPWYYYLKELVLIYPALPLLGAVLVLVGNKKLFLSQAKEFALFVWFAFYLAVIIYISQERLFLIRYLALLIPPMYAWLGLAAAKIQPSKFSSALVHSLFLLFLALNAMACFFYLFMFEMADMKSLFEIIYFTQWQS